MKSFEGGRIKAARQEKGWSVSDLHYQLARNGMRISLQSLRNWEKGTAVPSCENLLAISTILEREYEYFFG